MKKYLLTSSIISILCLTMYFMNLNIDFEKHRFEQLIIDAETSRTANSSVLNSEEKSRQRNIWDDIVNFRIIIKDYKLFSIEYLDVSKELNSSFNYKRNVIISFSIFGKIFDLDSGIENLYKFKWEFYKWKNDSYQPNGEKYVLYDSNIGILYPDKIIKSINSNLNNTNSLKVGDYFGGGIVAYILTKDDGVCLKPEGKKNINDWDGRFEENKIHGIIVSLNDINSFPVDFGKHMTLKNDSLIYWQPYVIGASKLNTNLIPESKDDYLYIENDISAISLCKSYNGGGFKDWSIPSIQELSILYLYKDYIGNFKNDFYWSSSFINSGRLPLWSYWVKNFYNGDVLPSFGKPEGKLANVRLVRYF